LLADRSAVIVRACTWPPAASAEHAAGTSLRRRAPAREDRGAPRCRLVL